MRLKPLMHLGWSSLKDLGGGGGPESGVISMSCFPGVHEQSTNKVSIATRLRTCSAA